MLKNRNLFIINKSSPIGTVKTNAGLPQGTPTFPIFFNVYSKSLIQLQLDKTKLIRIAIL